MYIPHENGNENYDIETGSFKHKNLKSAVKKVGFVTDTMTNIVLKGRWCDITSLNVHLPIENKFGDEWSSSHKKLERTFGKLPKLSENIC
jgi:hypothetical protein